MIDWHALFVPERPLEMLVRGTATFCFLYLLFRCVVRRRIGAVGMADLLILVIVADAIQNAMAGEYRTVTDGFILVATLVFWTIFTDWLSFRFPALQKLLEPAPLLLVRNGRMIRRNLRAEMVSEEELLSKIREKGLKDYAEVEEAWLEPEGGISVIPRGPRASSS